LRAWCYPCRLRTTAKVTAFRVASSFRRFLQFLDQVERDIALSASFFREHRITPSFYRCDFASWGDTTGFGETVRSYDAVILVPPDYPWVERFIEESTEAGAPPPFFRFALQPPSLHPASTIVRPGARPGCCWAALGAWHCGGPVGPRACTIRWSGAPVSPRSSKKTSATCAGWWNPIS
jgi:hypothetical protein